MSLALCDFAPQLRAGGALPVAPPFGAEPRAWPDAGASPVQRSVPGVAAWRGSLSVRTARCFSWATTSLERINPLAKCATVADSLVSKQDCPLWSHVWNPRS